MSWIPIGPSFVFGPKDVNYSRISRRNEYTANGHIWYIAIEPNNNNTLYVITRPSTGGAAAFRLDRLLNGKQQYVPISDYIQQNLPDLDPSCIAIHPQNAQIIFMGSYFDRGIYVSTRKGDHGSWTSKRNTPGVVKKIIIDPRPVRQDGPFNEDNTTLYISTDTGIYKSEDGGRNWIQTPLLRGDITSFTAHFSASGQSQFYAGVLNQGVYHKAGTQTTWTNVTIDPSLRVILGKLYLDYCYFNPNRIYVVNTITTTNTAGQPVEMSNLYTCQLPGPLRQVMSTNMPVLWWYDPFFAVSPNSVGDGMNDILFTGAYFVNRSDNGGMTWTDQTLDHTDNHAIAFFPPNPNPPRPGEPSEIPEVYIGNDGGLFLSSLLADRNFTAQPNGVRLTYHNQLERYDAISGDYQNLDHGRQGDSCIRYACHPALPSIGYLGNQDTGIAAHKGSLVWRRINNNDAFQIACAQGDNGIKIWCYYGSPFEIDVWNDRGGFLESRERCFFGSTGKRIECTSISMVVNSARQCIAGIKVKENDGTLTNPCVVRIGQDGIANQLSQVFQNSEVTLVCVHPTYDDIIYCVVNEGNNYFIYQTNQGHITFGQPQWQMWQQIGTLPSPTTSMTIDRSGNVYLLLRDSQTTGQGTDQITSPLYKITSGGRLEHQRCQNNPEDVSIFEKWPNVVSDPVHDNVLYVSHRSSVYKLTLNMDSGVPIWRWNSISNSLPGPPIFDLWIANISTIPAQPQILLRAAVTTRGLWELDLSPKASEEESYIYIRHNFLDTGYLERSPEGVPNPYNPRERVWHYQSPDIKIDMQKEIPDSGQTFYQTEPETSFPIDHIEFGRLKDYSQNLVHNKYANIFVQVHNHRNTSTNAYVWILFCRASAGVTSLPNNFWTQFNRNGIITPDTSIMTGSLWRQLDGASPVELYDIKASSPKVANWNWRIPRLDPSDLGHYCLVAFIHSGDSPIIDTISNLTQSEQRNVDLISSISRQIAQKNLHIFPSLRPRGSGESGADNSNSASNIDNGLAMIKDYIEFHNPEKSERTTSLVFDLSTLPKEIHVSIQFSKLQSLIDISSTTGVFKIEKSSNEEKFVKEDGTDIYFTEDIFHTEASSRVEIGGVIIPGNEYVSALLRISNEGVLEDGSEYPFDVLQIVNDEVVGGSTFLVRIAGRQENSPFSLEGDLDPDKDIKEQGHFTALPPDLREMAIERSKIYYKTDEVNIDASE